MVKVSNWTKFKLLLWKNWLLQWNHKTQMIMEMLIPALFTMLLVVLRQLVVPTKHTKRTYVPHRLTLMPVRTWMEYKAQESDSFKMPLMALAYSPVNIYLESIIKEAGESLQITQHNAFPTAEALESELYSKDYLAGVEFEDSMANLEDYPNKLKFALRFPGDLRASTSNFASSWQTSRLFPFISGNYPRNYNFSDGGSPVGYHSEGFLAIQHAISMAFLNLAQQDAAEKTELNAFSMLQLQRYPYPDFVLDTLLEGLQNVVSMILILSFIYPCISISKYVAHEKEKQLKEVMKIMGLQNWLHWCAWFLKAFISLMLSTIIILALITIEWTNDVAVLTKSDVTVVLFFLTVYVIVTVCFCFMLAVFFTKASTAAAATGLVWFIAYIPYLLTIEDYGEMNYSSKIALCFISNTAMAFGMKIILGFEGTGDGLQWKNLFEPYNADDELTVGTVIFVMLASAIIYMLICLYVEQVMPGDFGLPRKWYFPVSPDFWCPSERYTNEEDFIAARMSRRDQDHFEPDPKGLHAGIKIVNLKKRFREKWAVKGLSLNMYEDEITVLLGHNGAGKTTTISMLVGMFPPTAGTAFINGYNIMTDLNNARGSLGVCPQHNVLFDDMSVANHIIFFCRLKGLQEKEIQREIKKYLQLIDLEKKANTASRNLSGGMQRKLSVCCALCGGTKVVLLDEPSSGMDPAARRHMWNLIQGEKPGRTILITTHFMDEADVLGDRIAIMSGGELKCHGTSFFLKKKFGSGYRLICIKRENCDPYEVTKVLRKHIEDIEPDSNLGAELTYQLPYEYSSKFEELLKDLENSSERLDINGYGIAITSMEEVFLKVGAEKFGEEDIPNKKYDIYRDEDAESLQSNISFGGTIPSTRKPNLILNQWFAMFLKKILFTWHRKTLIFLQTFLPIFFIIMTVMISRQSQLGNLPPLNINLDEYPSAVIVLEITDRVKAGSLHKKIAKNYVKHIDSYGNDYRVEKIGNEKFSDYILKLGKTAQSTVNSRYPAAATIDVDIITAWFNNQPLHTAPLTINLVHNAIARAVLGPDYAIEVINKPLKQSEQTQVANLESGHSLGGQLASNVCFCMSFVTSLYVLFLIQENESKAKLLQFVSGVRVWIFWLTHLIWDMMTFVYVALVLVIALGLFQEEHASETHELTEFFVIVVVFGYAALPLTYILASYFIEPATGFARISMINIFLGMALYIVIMVLSNPLFDTKDVADGLIWLFMVYPHFSLAMGMNELYMGSAVHDMCNSEHIKAMSQELRCKMIEACCDPPTAFDWERPGVGAEIFYMVCVGSACILLLIGREYRVLQNIVINCKRRVKTRPTLRVDPDIDSDVAKEKWRIAAMSKEQIKNQHLVLDGVTKYYDHFLAVNQISLGVKRAECFGLLGVNGAGKTTTFKMLTGDEKLTYGQAYVRGYSILNEMNAVYTEIGYCPQFDALLDDLTGREVLRIFCLLRGIPSSRITYLSEELAKAFGFMKHMDKPVKTYSGGNKRKVSTAVAVLGNPSVVYLDEPTSGMDPGARRRLWNVVCMVRDSGKSIVLTSHSMEECEALCTRLAIMVNGEFKCIGSIQHLKNKFSKGFILKIKIKTFPASEMSPEMEQTLAAEGSSATFQSDNSIARMSDEKRSSNEEVQKEKLLRGGVKDLRGSVDSYYTPGEFETDTEEEEAGAFKAKPPTRTDNAKSKMQTSPKGSLSQSNSNDSERRQITRAMSIKYQSIMRETFVNKVRTAIEKRFPKAGLQEYYQGMLTYYVPLGDATWSDIFGFMEKAKEELNIEDYAISQTTLEEIFLEFAKQQVDFRIHSPKKGCCAFLKSK